MNERKCNIVLVPDKSFVTVVLRSKRINVGRIKVRSKPTGGGELSQGSALFGFGVAGTAPVLIVDIP